MNRDSDLRGEEEEKQKREVGYEASQRSTEVLPLAAWTSLVLAGVIWTWICAEQDLAACVCPVCMWTSKGDSGGVQVSPQAAREKSEGCWLSLQVNSTITHWKARFGKLQIQDQDQQCWFRGPRWRMCPAPLFLLVLTCWQSGMHFGL